MDFAKYIQERAVRPSTFGRIAKVYPNIVLSLIRKERGSISLENAVKIINKCEGRVRFNDLLECIGSDVRYFLEDEEIDISTNAAKTRTKQRRASQRS